MKIEIITPEQVLYEGEVNDAKFTGIDGKFEVLSHHAPMVSALGKGDIRLKEEGGEEKVFPIESGLLEVKDNVLQVIAQ